MDITNIEHEGTCMDDGLRHEPPTLRSLGEARTLALKVADAIRQRDELIEELRLLRQIIAEFSFLRELLDDDAPGVIALAAGNGHLAAAHVGTGATVAATPDDVSGDVIRELETTPHVGAGGSATPALLTDAADRQGDLDICDTQVVKTSAVDEAISDITGHVASNSDRDQADIPSAMVEADDCHNESKASDVNVRHRPPSQLESSVEKRQGEPAVDRPPPETLLGRILSTIEASDKPLRSWRIQKELGLPRVPTAELSRLIQRGLVTRRGEALYGVAGRTYGESGV